MGWEFPMCETNHTQVILIGKIDPISIQFLIARRFTRLSLYIQTKKSQLQPSFKYGYRWCMIYLLKNTPGCCTAVRLFELLPSRWPWWKMEKSYTISKMVQFEHTWIIEPSLLQPHCPRCEVVTGSVKWEINGCLGASQGTSECTSCSGPYLQLMTGPARAAMIGIREEGFDRKIYLPFDQYSVQSDEKLPLVVMDASSISNPGRRKRRKVVCTFSMYVNISVDRGKEVSS